MCRQIIGIGQNKQCKNETIAFEVLAFSSRRFKLPRSEVDLLIRPICLHSLSSDRLLCMILQCHLIMSQATSNAVSVSCISFLHVCHRHN